MANRKTKPTSPGRRFGTYPMREELTDAEPTKGLTKGKNSTGGQELQGPRHRPPSRRRPQAALPGGRLPARQGRDSGQGGGGQGVRPQPLGPPRSLHYPDGEKRYILSPEGLRWGPRSSRARAPTSLPGQLLPARWIPTGTIVRNIRSFARARAASSAARRAPRPARREGGARSAFGCPRVRCGWSTAIATRPSDISNADHQNVSIGKAGRTRHLGRPPRDRGVAMNPVDHPHGGGEAHHTPGGHPVTPWGKPTLGFRTRKKGKRSDALIVRGRRRGKRK